MKQLLFSPIGRINRALFWKATLVIVVAGLVTVALCKAIASVIPGSITDDGSYSVSGVAALPFIFIVFGFIVFSAWVGICIGVKRYHDRNKSGFWLFIQFIPFIGVIWNFVETGCLEGTIGPNRYGPDPIARTGAAPAYAVTP